MVVGGHVGEEVCGGLVEVGGVGWRNTVDEGAGNSRSPVAVLFRLRQTTRQPISVPRNRSASVATSPNSTRCSIAVPRFTTPCCPIPPRMPANQHHPRRTPQRSICSVDEGPTRRCWLAAFPSSRGCGAPARCDRILSISARKSVPTLPAGSCAPRDRERSISSTSERAASSLGPAPAALASSRSTRAQRLSSRPSAMRKATSSSCRVKRWARSPPVRAPAT